MDFTFDQSLANEILEISSKFDLDYWKQIDTENRFPDEYWNVLSKSGLFGVLIGKEYGGREKGILDLFQAILTTSECYAGLGSYVYLSESLVSKIIATRGTQQQKNDLLPKLARGELKISIALTEASSGLDAATIETVAKDVGGIYKISGSKTFINNADLTDYLIVFARTSEIDPDSKRSVGITMFLVDAHDPLIIKKKKHRLGMNFVNSFELKFQELSVDGSAIVGEIGRGWYNVIDIFNLDRVLTSASLVGTGRLALNEASTWARKRTVFGRPIGQNQGIQFPLADASAQLAAAELMGLKAASSADRGMSFEGEGSFALLASMNAAAAATDRALQTFGGHGYYRDFHVERFWRDVRAHKVHPISEELLLASIAERTLGLPKSY